MSEARGGVPETTLEVRRPSPSVGEALATLRARSAVQIASLRLLAWLATLGLAFYFGLFRGRPDWRADLPLHAFFAALACLLLICLTSDRLRGPVRRAAPLLDVLTIYLLQTDSLPRSPFPAGIAGWSLGPFVLVVLLASLTLRPSLIYGTALVAAFCEGLLQRQAGVGGGAIGASAVVLLVTAAATHFAARRIEALVARLVAEQVTSQLAAARSADLLRAHAVEAEAKTALEAQNGRLQAAQRQAEMLSALLVHDMKGPLTTVLLRLDMAQRDLEGKPELVKLAKDVRIARVQGQRLLGMIQDLLAIARLEQGTLLVKALPIDLAALLHDTAAGYEALAQTLQVKLGISVEPGLHAAADRELLERVLENLLSNALRFVRAGDAVEVEARRQGRELFLSVRNNGPPVSERLRGRLFERFSGESDRDRGNAGLGLYFCRLVAEAHGGSIALVDEPGFTVSFLLRLPIGEPAT